MAKEQEVKTLDDAFSDDSNFIGTVKDDAGQVSTDTPETQPETDADKTAEEKTAETAEQAFKWGKFGLDRYDTMSPEQIAEDVRYRQRLYGDQANELGELRKRSAEAKAELEKFKQLATGSEKKVEAKIADMTMGELQDFYAAMEKNPRAAIQGLLGDNFRQSLVEEITNQLNESIGPQMKDATSSAALEAEFRDFTTRHPDWREQYGAMEVLTQEEHLGQDRTYEDIYQLAKLAQTDESLYKATYQLMRKSNMSFTECSRYAKAVMNAPAETDETKEKLKAEVAKVQGGGTSTTSKVSEDGKIMTMDDAFGITD